MERINFEDLCLKIQEKTGCEPEVYPNIKGDTTIIIAVECLTATVDTVLKYFDYCHLSTITAQQRNDQPEEIQIFYSFWVGQSLSLMIKLPESSMKLPSIISIIPGADFYEREVSEMFGIEFTGRQETPPLLLPDDWDQGPPFMKKENDG